MHTWESKANLVVTARSGRLVHFAANKTLSGVKAGQEERRKRPNVRKKFSILEIFIFGFKGKIALHNDPGTKKMKPSLYTFLSYFKEKKKLMVSFMIKRK